MVDEKPVDVTDDNFGDVVLGSGMPVVVEFWSPKCSHCERMVRTVDALAKEFAGRLKVVKVNVLENTEAPREFDIKAIPAFLYIKDNEVVASTVGAKSKGRLKEELGLK